MGHTIFNKFWVYLLVAPLIACDGQPLCSYNCGGGSFRFVSDEVVGSRECDVLRQTFEDVEEGAQLCEECQGAVCEEDIPDYPLFDCEVFPCVDGARIVQGCKTSTDCDNINQSLPESDHTVCNEFLCEFYQI